jgi:hypothetical protein
VVCHSIAGRICNRSPTHLSLDFGIHPSTVQENCKWEFHFLKLSRSRFHRPSQKDPNQKTWFDKNQRSKESQSLPKMKLDRWTIKRGRYSLYVSRCLKVWDHDVWSFSSANHTGLWKFHLQSFQLVVQAVFSALKSTFVNRSCKTLGASSANSYLGHLLYHIALWRKAIEYFQAGIFLARSLSACTFYSLTYTFPGQISW